MRILNREDITKNETRLSQIIFLRESFIFNMGDNKMNKQLQEILDDKDFNSQELIDFLRADVGDRFEADAGLWEGYSIKEHTLMALGQFEKYFASQNFPKYFSRGIFRLFLALHDIGKPDAIAQGDKNLQHKFTVPIIRKILAKYCIGKTQTDIACALIDIDIPGDYIRDRISLECAVQKLHQNAKRAKLPTEKFFELLLIFYKCDAGSYTVDAGGFESLDFLFEFDYISGKLCFAKDVEHKIQEIKSQF